MRPLTSLEGLIESQICQEDSMKRLINGPSISRNTWEYHLLQNDLIVRTIIGYLLVRCNGSKYGLDSRIELNIREFLKKNPPF